MEQIHRLHQERCQTPESEIHSPGPWQNPVPVRLVFRFHGEANLDLYPISLFTEIIAVCYAIIRRLNPIIPTDKSPRSPAQGNVLSENEHDVCVAFMNKPHTLIWEKSFPEFFTPSQLSRNGFMV